MSTGLFCSKGRREAGILIDPDLWLTAQSLKGAITLHERRHPNHGGVHITGTAY
jgi:hypothetical protein